MKNKHHLNDPTIVSRRTLLQGIWGASVAKLPTQMLDLIAHGAAMGNAGNFFGVIPYLTAYAKFGALENFGWFPGLFIDSQIAALGSKRQDTKAAEEFFANYVGTLKADSKLFADKHNIHRQALIAASEDDSFWRMLSPKQQDHVSKLFLNARPSEFAGEQVVEATRTQCHNLAGYLLKLSEVAGPIENNGLYSPSAALEKDYILKDLWFDVADAFEHTLHPPVLMSDIFKDKFVNFYQRFLARGVAPISENTYKKLGLDRDMGDYDTIQAEVQAEEEKERRRTKEARSTAIKAGLDSKLFDIIHIPRSNSQGLVSDGLRESYHIVLVEGLDDVKRRDAHNTLLGLRIDLEGLGDLSQPFDGDTERDDNPYVHQSNASEITVIDPPHTLKLVLEDALRARATKAHGSIQRF